MENPIDKAAIDQLKALQNMVFIVTHRKDYSVKIDNNNSLETAFVQFDKKLITLSDQVLPIGLKAFPLEYGMALDGECLHESGHILKTLPNNDKLTNWEKTQRYQKLASSIVNIIEDKRINNFLAMRYRLDYGSRLYFLLNIMQKAIFEKVKTLTPIVSLDRKSVLTKNGKVDFSSFFMNLTIQKGLYSADISNLEKVLNETEKTDLNEICNLLENIQDENILHYILKSATRYYEIVSKYIFNDDSNIKELIPKAQEGNLELDLDPDTKAQLEGKAKAEKAKEGNLTEKEVKGKPEENKKIFGKTEGTEILAPSVNYPEYNRLCNKNAHLINELLNELKKTVKPKTIREIYQRKGRLMSNILARSYGASYSRPQNNIYTNQTSTIEKQKVAISFLFDISGSVDRNIALDTITVLNESFGKFVSDKEFSIACFASDIQRIKTFFETYETTKARIPNVECGGGNSKEFITLLESYAKQYNNISKEYKKICVIITDFQLAVESGVTIKLIENAMLDLINNGVSFIFLGIDRAMPHINDYLPNNPNVRRVIVKNMSDLPKLFIEIYLKASGSCKQ